MKKLFLILREVFRLIRRNKAYFLAPILILLGLLAILVYTVGPSAIVAFIYAGI
jgi:hypothetical protein